MTRGMKRVWWAQVKAVIRLELKKTFFAKRGLWIYLVAGLPVLLFIAFALTTAHQQGLSAGIARQGEKPLAYQDLLAVKPGITRDEVVAMLGKPPVTFHWTENPPPGAGKKEGAVEVLHAAYHYSHGQHDLYCGMSDSQVD